MILITGATGKTGMETARQLAASGVPFRALVRDRRKSGALEDLGADIVVGDIAEPDALRAALDGIRKALLVLSNDEAQLRLEKGFTDAAVAAGVSHLVKLSSMESVPESTKPITRNHVASERHIRDSGLDWTMIRPTFFMQTLLGSAPRIRETGEIRMPGGSGTVAATDVRDVGAVIKKVLTEPGHENKSYDLTGPELLTFEDIAEQFSQVLGTPIRYVDQPVDEFRALLQSLNLSEWRVEAVCKEFEAIANGAIDHTTQTVEELLGRPPISLERFIADHAAAFGGS